MFNSLADDNFPTSDILGHYGSLRPLNRMTLTKETNIDEPLNNTWSYPHSTQPPISRVSQPMYMNTAPGWYLVIEHSVSNMLVIGTSLLASIPDLSGATIFPS